MANTISTGVFTGGDGKGSRNKIWGSLVFWDSQGIFEQEVQRVSDYLSDRGYDKALKMFEEEVKDYRSIHKE